MPAYPKKKLPDITSQLAAETLAGKLGTTQAQHPKIAMLRTIVPFDQYAMSGIDYPGLGVGGGVMLASDMPFAFLESFLKQGLYPVDPLSSLVMPAQKWAAGMIWALRICRGPKFSQSGYWKANTKS